MSSQEEDSIEDLQGLLRSLVGEYRKISRTEISRLTALGENFGSIMLRVEVTLTDKDGKEETLQAVAKKLPTVELLREIFNIQVTFRNEMAFYSTIVPTLRDFQKECGIEEELVGCFAEFYGARISLDDNSNVVDDDAVLVLENLAVSGYSNIDRFKGFDLELSEYLIRDLARFHAVTIALKLKRPEVFERRVKATCHNFKMKPELSQICLEAVQEILKGNPECVPLIPKVSLWGQRPLREGNGPFATLVHADLWVNNTLQKFEDGKVVGNKIVDFQVYAYRSVASDLFFFLWSSVQLDVLKSHLDFLLKYYHKVLTETLEKFRCDTTLFSYDAFLKEMELESEFEFGHAMQFATFVVLGKKGSQLSEVPTKENFLKNLPSIAKERAWYMTLECERRGWLQ